MTNIIYLVTALGREPMIQAEAVFYLNQRDVYVDFFYAFAFLSFVDVGFYSIKIFLQFNIYAWVSIFLKELST